MLLCSPFNIRGFTTQGQTSSQASHFGMACQCIATIFGEVKKAVQEEQDKDHLESTGYGGLLVLGKVSNAGLWRLVMRHAKNLAADLEEG